ncbi:MAG: SDR family NAD-dependent epimerase/dehydratase, partial [Deltaproteobacteria bacterium]
KLTNSKSKIVYSELSKDDPIRRSPDITLAKSKLNWEPKISLIDGLKRTIEYYKNLRSSQIK